MPSFAFYEIPVIETVYLFFKKDPSWCQTRMCLLLNFMRCLPVRLIYFIKGLEKIRFLKLAVKARLVYIEIIYVIYSKTHKNYLQKHKAFFTYYEVPSTKAVKVFFIVLPKICLGLVLALQDQDRLILIRTYWPRNVKNVSRGVCLKYSVNNLMDRFHNSIRNQLCHIFKDSHKNYPQKPIQHFSDSPVNDIIQIKLGSI